MENRFNNKGDVMKRLLCICSLVLFIGLFGSSITAARCVGPVVNGNCLGTEVQGEDEPQQNYRGVNGTTYQYNLRNPLDWNRYSLDQDARRRDQMNTDPRRNSDIEQGQYGGGIYGR